MCHLRYKWASRAAVSFAHGSNLAGAIDPFRAVAAATDAF